MEEQVYDLAEGRRKGVDTVEVVAVAVAVVVVADRIAVVAGDGIAEHIHR